VKRSAPLRTSVSGGRGTVSGERQREPLGARISTSELDAVDELGENAGETRVITTPFDEGPDRYRNVTILGFHLDRDLVSAHSVEDAQQRELKVVHALVREIQSAADAPEHKRGDAAKPAFGRDRQHDLLVHFGVGSFIHDLGPRSAVT